jgi:hypothetical protein
VSVLRVRKTLEPILEVGSKNKKKKTLRRKKAKVPPQPQPKRSPKKIKSKSPVKVRVKINLVSKSKKIKSTPSSTAAVPVAEFSDIVNNVVLEEIDIKEEAMEELSENEEMDAEHIVPDIKEEFIVGYSVEEIDI